MQTVFDIGMFDGADTAYYLECGYRVVSVEANPELAEQAKQRFAAEMASGQWICVNAAISPDGKPVELNLVGHELGSSSLFSDRVASRRPTGTITVPGVTLDALFTLHSVPEYLKIDIEGADRLCILSLTAGARPKFVSFEVGEDVDELLVHLQKVGYTRFKVISQESFRELANQRSLIDRLAHRLMRYMGYKEPRLIRRAGRFFVTGHSSGPVPWQSDGQWQSCETARARLHAAKAAGDLAGWYDIHATF